eukprot:gb/GEZN01013376.1/.p1 GENE.gb/GEZN01013376.1/~~gb/GEZN01013376.1/.p1  ORF type:complete len:116 (+),score=14.59 gb/GEZN01013376.1/:76-423(+)
MASMRLLSTLGLATIGYNGQKLVNTNRLFDFYFHGDLDTTPVVYRQRGTSTVRTQLEEPKATASSIANSDSDEEEDEQSPQVAQLEKTASDSKRDSPRQAAKSSKMIEKNCQFFI